MAEEKRGQELKKLYDPETFNQLGPLGDVDRLGAGGVVELKPGMVAMSGWLTKLVSRIRLSRGLDPKTGEAPDALKADINTPLMEQPSLPAYPDVTPKELADSVNGAIEAYMLDRDESLQTVCGVPVFVEQAAKTFSIVAVPTNPAEASMSIFELWDYRAANARAMRKALEDDGARSEAPAREARAKPETLDKGKSEGSRAPVTKAKGRTPRQWPTVRFPVGAVKARTGRDGKPIPAMRNGEQMVVSGGTHRGEPMFSGVATLPKGTMVDGQDVSGFRVLHLLKRSDLEAVEKGKGVTLQFNPSRPVRLIKGFGDNQTQVMADDPAAFAKAVRDARDALEGRGDAKDAPVADDGGRQGPRGEQQDAPAKRRGWPGALFPKGSVEIVRDGDENPMPAKFRGKELRVESGPHAGEALYRVRVSMPEGASIKGVDVGGMSFETNMREPMLASVGSPRGTYVSLSPSRPVRLSNPPESPIRQEVTVEDPWEIVGSVKSALSKSGPVRVSHVRAEPARDKAEGPRLGVSPKLDEVPGTTPSGAADGPAPRTPHRMISRG